MALNVPIAEGPHPPDGSPTIGRNWRPCVAQSSAVLSLSYASAAAPGVVTASGGASNLCGEVMARSRAADQLGMNTSAGRLRAAPGCSGHGWSSPGFSTLGSNQQRRRRGQHGRELRGGVGCGRRRRRRQRGACPYCPKPSHMLDTSRRQGTGCPASGYGSRSRIPMAPRLARGPWKEPPRGSRCPWEHLGE